MTGSALASATVAAILLDHASFVCSADLQVRPRVQSLRAPSRPEGLHYTDSKAPATETPGNVVERAARWVEQFERDFITVIADETYDQVASGSSEGGEAHRQIRSEMLFTRGEAHDRWFAVRNVLAYTDDGRPAIAVPNRRDRLDRALESGRGRTALRQVADEGARFNIGAVARNFNTPTLALQFLEDDHRWRFRFRLDGVEVIGGEDARRLSFKEREHPTLIKANFRDTELSGRIWTRASDGAVLLRTTMELVDRANRGLAGLRTLVTVDYMYDAKLARLVPARMEEEYAGRDGDEVIRGTAVYSSYRVFETSARVIVPQ